MPSLRIVSKVVGKKAKTKTDVKENSTQKLPVTPEANSSPWPYPIKLGNKVKFPLANKTSSGVVKFIGPTKFSSGLWCGIELNKPEGRNNGTVKGVKYFDCKFNYGIFIQADRVTCIDGEQEKEKKQRQNLPRFSGFNKARSKSLDHVSLELDDKQLDPKEVADVKDVKLHDGENIGDDRFNLIDTIDEVSEVEDNMRITKEIEIDNSQMTVKIVENSNDDNNNLPLEAENDHEMIICVTGHQHLPSARPKSCSMLNSIPILNSGNVSPSLSAKDDDTDESSVTEELRRGSTLKRRLSGIEKRIRSAQLRSPGALRKAFSHGTVYPKENYVAFDENTGKLRRPLKRSQSDLTVYHRPQYTKGDAPKVPPIVSKPWLRRERTSPELVGEESKEDDVVKDDQVSVNGDVSKSNVDNALGKEVETQVDDGIGKVVAADVNDVEANVVAEMNEETVVPEVVATCDTELAVSEVLDAVVNEDFVDKKNGSNKEMKQTQSKGLSVNNGNSKSCEKEKMVLASSRKLSVPIRMQQRSLKNASTVKLSQSQNELDKRYDRNNKVDKIILNSADKVGPPSKLNKKVSDIVATFEKTKPGDSGDKKYGSIVKCSSNKISGGKTSIKITKTIVKTAARKSSESSNDKDARKSAPIANSKKRQSPFSKEEIAAKEKLSQQYVEKEATRRTSAPAKTNLSDRVSSPRVSASSVATPRTPANKSVKAQQGSNVKGKVLETPRKTSIPIKSTIPKLSRPGGLPSSQQLTDDEKKIIDLKEKCEKFENEIDSMKDDLRNKDVGIEAFIIIIKQHIKMIEESSRNLESVNEKNDHLETELTDTSNLLETNQKRLADIEERLEQSSRDYKKQIESLKKVHNLEIERTIQELKEEEQLKIQEVTNTLNKKVEDLKEQCENEVSALKHEHEKMKQDFQDKHIIALKEKEQHYIKSIEEMKLRSQTEKEEVCLDYEDRLQDLHNQLESTQENLYDLEAKNGKLEEEIEKSIEGRLQGELARYKNLPAELESLQSVVDLKNEQLKKARTQNMELQKKVEDFYELEKKFQKVYQEKEALLMALQNKTKCERQLSVERESLAADLEMESRKVKRLSMEKEELMWKFNNSNSSLSLSSPSLNIDPPTSPSNGQSTPNSSSRSFGRGRSHKTQSMYLPTLDDEDYTLL